MSITLHFFNPETDYALAADIDSYTPPMPVLAMRSNLSLLPSLYSEPEDAVLMPDDNQKLIQENNPFARLAEDKKLMLVQPRFLKDFLSKFPITEIRPWGWNRSLCHWLDSLGVKPEYIPTVDEINVLRKLSHRRLTIPFLRNMEDILNPNIDIPYEFTNVDEALSFYDTHRNVYYKAPWSSSGRGLLYTEGLERRHIEPWLKGIIRSQGSVMGEKAYNRSLDCASEWECKDGQAMFLGMSTFITSKRGRYKSNVVAPQENILAYILSKIAVTTPGNNMAEIIERQRLLLENYVAPFYDGPVGIDMLVTEEGDLNPCVEINLRNTMGRVAIDIRQRIAAGNASDNEINILRHLTIGGIFSPMSIISKLRDINSN